VKKENDRIKVALDSLGCKLNQAEMELLGRRFAAAGYDVVAPGDSADVYILNTCTVTSVADSKSRQRLRAARRRNRGTATQPGCLGGSHRLLCPARPG